VTFHPQLITTRTRRGERTIVAFASTDAPLAYHPTLLYNDMKGEHTSATEWSITHLPTGRELPPRFPTYQRCERFIALAAHICNWRIIRDKVAGHRAARRLHCIMARLCWQAQQDDAQESEAAE